MKNPNGFGCVKRLKGNRRKPYLAEKTLGYVEENGKKKRIRQTIGYYATLTEAQLALAEANKDPYVTKAWTFEEVYKRWSGEHFPNISKGSAYSYEKAYERFSQLHERKFSTIKTLEMEETIKEADTSQANKRGMKSLLNELNKYALKYEATDRDYASLFVVSRPDTKIVREVYTQEEIDTLWANQNPITEVILIQLYTGMRLAEVLTCEKDEKEQLFIGGVKTESGKNRIIPIHPKIKNIPLPQFNTNDYQYQYRKEMKRLGMNHKTHDARVTFASALEDRANDLCVKLIMGHKVTDITKRVYSKKTIEQLRETILLLPY